MKKTNTLLLFFAISLYGSSQQVDFDVSFDYLNAKIKLPPGVKRLGEDIKFKVIYPETLTYNTSNREIAAVDLGYWVRIDAKKAKKDDEADYQFKFTCAGMKPMIVGEPEAFQQTRTMPYPNPPVVVKGYVMKIKYTIPVTLEVINKQGQVEHTYKLNPDGGTAIYHKEYLTPVTFGTTTLVTPFANPQDATAAFKKSENAVYKLAEMSAWQQSSYLARSIIELAYGDYKLSENTFYYHTLSKKGKAGLPELALIIEKEKDFLGDLDDDKKLEAALQGLKDLLPAYDSIINNKEAYGPKLQKLALSNAAWAAVLNGQTQRAANYFSQYYQVENDSYANGTLIRNFGLIFKDFNIRDFALDKNPITEVDEDIAYLYPEKVAIAVVTFDPATVNINRVDGQAEKENGEVIKGKISIQFAAKAGGIVDMDLGKAATVYFDKNGSETYQFAKVNNTKRILIGERVFEPVGRRNSALMGILKSTSGDFGNTYFMERIYEKNGFIVYKFWEPYETLLIKHRDGDKAIDLSMILQGKKLAKQFEETCPGLEDFIRNNKLVKIQADAVRIVDFLANGCK